MAHEVRAVVATAKGAPVSVETIIVPDPGPGEAVVQIQACGVCHTDLHYREGGINDEFPVPARPRSRRHRRGRRRRRHRRRPRRLRHPQLARRLRRMPRLRCKGRPQYCFNTHNATQKMTLLDGTELSPALGIGAFAEKTLVAAGQCTKVDPSARPAAAGLLGCGVMAGIGAAINTGGVTRGDTVAVIGCGGVGDAAIAGANLVGATTIIAVDVDPTKLEWAKGFGATHTINSREVDAVESHQGTHRRVRRRRRHRRRRPPGETLKQAFFARDLAGTAVLVGVPTPDMTFDIPMIEIFGRGGATKSSWYGDCLPSRDFPMLIDLYLQGRLDLDKFVSEDDRPRRRRGSLPQDGARRGPPLGRVLVRRVS
jgi:S-(hydroxymethyl)mycothiol dehydrogenase